MLQRPGPGRGGGLQAAQLLHHVQDRHHRQEDRVRRRGHADTHQVLEHQIFFFH